MNKTFEFLPEGIIGGETSEEKRFNPFERGELLRLVLRFSLELIQLLSSLVNLLMQLVKLAREAVEVKPNDESNS